jgi:hypothetical protein
VFGVIRGGGCLGSCEGRLGSQLCCRQDEDEDMLGDERRRRQPERSNGAGCLFRQEVIPYILSLSRLCEHLFFSGQTKRLSDHWKLR